MKEHEEALNKVVEDIKQSGRMELSLNEAKTITLLLITAGKQSRGPTECTMVVLDVLTMLFCRLAKEGIGFDAMRVVMDTFHEMSNGVRAQRKKRN